MNIKDLIGETADTKRKSHLKPINLRASVK